MSDDGWGDDAGSAPAKGGGGGGGGGECRKCGEEGHFAKDCPSGGGGGGGDGKCRNCRQEVSLIF